MSDLLPCPFCGGEPIVHDAKPGGHQPVQCLNDQCCMSRMWPDIRQWQRRAALTQATATAAPLPSSPESAGSHSPEVGLYLCDHGHSSLPCPICTGVAQEAGNGARLDVIARGYGWQVHTETGELYALTAGDHGYEPTGIIIDADSRPPAQA
jgi:hypothetical protein